ncbi:hypothetical protein CANCADRAFT_962 [Tortispora caseinolytica NRRL Y-17796]|uniref:Flavin-nucleotide-binding protein n=1 Tax=Tortispora caseinolytica NRRL Y-17796 TaxID=767744 RepID=A0A1E4TKU5_9ASCO|nr:hypothetical protein CANCADRAFT_962 [Tortispora caseinolytica NRRL Y-17796]
MSLRFPKTKLNTPTRGLNRDVYELEPIQRLIHELPSVTVSFVVDNRPVCMPMIAAMGSFDNPSSEFDEPLDAYVHGYVSFHLANLLREAGDEGIPICLSGHTVDALVLTSTPFSHSMNYRSAIIHGNASLVTEEEEKLYAMKIITNSIVPDRWDHCNGTPLPAEIATTSIIKVKVASGTYKARTGQGNEKSANYDPSTLGSIWVGNVPFNQTFGEPIPASYVENQIPVPGYLQEYLDYYNQKNQKYKV